MDDREIIALLEARSENGIQALRQKYSALCLGIARRALGNDQDAEECLADVCLAVWNTIPPEKPQSLYAYVGNLARHTAIDRFRRLTAGKRRSGLALSLDELTECLPDKAAEGTLDSIILRDTLNAFLEASCAEDRSLFLLRYWYGYSHGQIAKRCGLSAGTVRTRLCRMRARLRRALEEAGIRI